MPIFNKFYDPQISCKGNKITCMHIQTLNHIFAQETYRTIVCEGIHCHVHCALNAKNLKSSNNLENKHSDSLHC